ncbi:SnoaL-like polyketide cyclase [Lachancea thermotolerans]
MTEQSTPLWLQDRDAVIAQTPAHMWRLGKPTYKFTDRRLNRERQVHFEPGSLGDLVTNLARVFEMEATNKANPDDWISVDPRVFRMTVNGSREYTVQDIVTKGGYNVFLGDLPNYKASESDYAKSEDAFHKAFRTGFLWEILTLEAELPIATFTWRHWGQQNGVFNGHKGDGSVLDIKGTTRATLNDKLQLVRLEHTFDAPGMINTLSGVCPMAH